MTLKAKFELLKALGVESELDIPDEFESLFRVDARKLLKSDGFSAVLLRGVCIAGGIASYRVEVVCENGIISYSPIGGTLKAESHHEFIGVDLDDIDDDESGEGV